MALTGTIRLKLVLPRGEIDRVRRGFAAALEAESGRLVRHLATSGVRMLAISERMVP